MSKNFNYGNNNAANDDGAAVDAILGEVKSLIQPAVELQDTVKAIKSQQSGIVSDVKKLIDFMNGGGLPISDGSNGDSFGRQAVALLPEIKGHKAARREVKNTILGESGSPQNPDGIIVAPDRRPGIVPGAFRPLNLLDVIPRGRTSSNQVEYTRENSFSNNAAERLEATQKPESDLTFELIQEPVRTIPHFIKMSRQALEDAPAAAAYIDARMRHGILNRLQTQIILGNGSGANLAGISASERFTEFTPEPGDTALDSIGRAADEMRGDDYTPSIVILNPLDHGAILRLKRDATDGGYALDTGARNIMNGLPSVWGLPVVVNNSMTLGSFAVIDLSQIMLFMRQEAVVEMFEQDSNNVQFNLITIRAELRAAFAVFAQAAVRFGYLTSEET